MTPSQAPPGSDAAASAGRTSGASAARVDPGDGETALAVEAVRAAARVSRILERSTDELTLPQYRVLAAIASGEERASRVADRLALGRPTISAAVEHLTKRGFVRREIVASDQRAAALSVTDEGAALLSRTEAAMAERVSTLCNRTPDPDRTMQSLVWLGAALDELHAERTADRPSERPTEPTTERTTERTLEPAEGTH